jgi:hypothetical protein
MIKGQFLILTRVDTSPPDPKTMHLDYQKHVFRKKIQKKWSASVFSRLTWRSQRLMQAREEGNPLNLLDGAQFANIFRAEGVWTSLY